MERVSDRCIGQDQRQKLLAYEFEPNEVWGGTEKDLNLDYSCLELLQHDCL